MKKKSILFSLIIFSLIFPFFVFATSIINLEFFSENTNSQTGKIDLWLKVNATTNVLNGTIVPIDLYKNGVKDGPTIKVTMTNNFGEYRTGSVLDPGTKYTVKAIFLGQTTNFEITTKGDPILGIDNPVDPKTGIGVWSYKEGSSSSSKTSTTFETKEACEEARVIFFSKNLIIQPTVCEFSLTEGYPVTNLNKIIYFTPQTKTTTPTGVYTLLAPIGEFKVAPKDIGDYFNTIFLIAIGLCGALAVIMIVIGGIQYMGDESIFGKTEAKSRITSAILGLLIALGAYALLNTINPDLLGKGGVHIKQVSAEILEPPMLQESTQIPLPGTPINQCTEGIVSISTNGVNMHVCGRISNQVTNIIKAAWTANPQIKLSGAAFRSKADQVNFRIANKCPDVYTSPASDCKPPTAKPGTSMHESGLAIDFKCEGQSISTKDNKCFIWLSQNAKTAGLINFAKEPWHWSTTGT